jgi:hypothetical protein
MAVFWQHLGDQLSQPRLAGDDSEVAHQQRANALPW